MSGCTACSDLPTFGTGHPTVCQNRLNQDNSGLITCSKNTPRTIPRSVAHRGVLSRLYVGSTICLDYAQRRHEPTSRIHQKLMLPRMSCWPLIAVVLLMPTPVSVTHKKRNGFDARHGSPKILPGALRDVKSWNSNPGAFECSGKPHDHIDTKDR